MKMNSLRRVVSVVAVLLACVGFAMSLRMWLSKRTEQTPAVPSAAPCPSCPACEPRVVPAELVDTTPQAAPKQPSTLYDCAPNVVLENKGNRVWCVEVAEAPPGTDDEVMHRAGRSADRLLRKYVAWIRHGLGTRAKDRRRVVRYYNVTRPIAEAACPFLDCSDAWLGTKDDDQPGVERTCRVMQGEACDR